MTATARRTRPVAISAGRSVRSVADELAAAVDARLNGDAPSTKAKARRSIKERALSRSAVAAGDVNETDEGTTKTVAALSAKSRKAKTAAKPAKVAKVKAVKVVKVKVPRVRMTSYGVRKDGTLSARDLTCLCGCGATTVTNDARFISGHDAKLRQSVLSSGEPTIDSLPAIIQPFFSHGETVAGLRLASDGSIIDTKADEG